MRHAKTDVINEKNNSKWFNYRMRRGVICKPEKVAKETLKMEICVLFTKKLNW